VCILRRTWTFLQGKAAVKTATVINQVSPYQAFALFYDRVMGDAVATLIERNFELSRRRHDIRFDSAADIGCGTGRLLARLSRHCDVLYGVDRSVEMLAEARRRTQNRDIRFLRQDLRDFRLPQRVDLITCTFDTLNYLTTPSGLERALAQVRDNLRDGGHFIFDLITGAGERNRRRIIRQRFQVSNAQANWLITMDGPRRVSRVEMLWSCIGRNGQIRRWREVHQQRWYPLTLLCGLLQRCGLAVLGIHNTTSFEPASERTFWAHLVARKAS
jgi:SAM-dependent methyltransferase